MRNLILSICTVVVIVIVAVNVTVNLSNGVKFSDLRLKNIVALSQEGEKKTEILRRIVSYCNCYGNNGWMGMSITGCEDYEWSIPMNRTTCVLTSCPPQTNCY
jgi:hypothetical protein